MAAANAEPERRIKRKDVYSQDGVFVHTAVPTVTHSANIIPGRVTIFEQDNHSFVDWSPSGLPEDEFQFDTSDFSEWNLVTQSKPEECNGEELKEKKAKYAIHFNTKDLKSIRRSDPKLSWSYIVFILKDQNTLPALHFHAGGIREMISTLQRYLWLTKSPKNPKLYIVDDDDVALRKSFDQLQLYTDGQSSSSYVPKILNYAYSYGMDALPKVTKVVRDIFDDMVQTGQEKEQVPGPSQEPLPVSPRKDAEFEDLGSCRPVNRALPEKTDLGEVPEVMRESPMNDEEWRTMLDKSGRVLIVKKLHERIFRGGVEHSVRKEVWKFLLGYYKYGCTYSSRQTIITAKDEEYKTMKWQWQSMSAKQERHFSELRSRKELIAKDVHRTDRTQAFYTGDDNPNLRKLSDILTTYCMYNFDLGYVQGMSDLLAPVLLIMEDEVEAFWCFTGLMSKLAHNFDMSQEGMKVQLQQLATLVKFVDPGFFSYLEEHESGNLYFCFRWLLINFKREFSFPDIMTLWEALWTQHLSPNFHLFICLAILDKHRQVMLEMEFGFTEILRYINDLAYHIDVQETLVTAEKICLQLLTLPNLPDEVRKIVTGKNVAVMTPDSERSNPFQAPHRALQSLVVINENGSSDEGPGDEAGTSTALAGNQGAENAETTVMAGNLDEERTNDLSIITSDELRGDVGAAVNEQPLNVEEPSSDDEIVVLSEEAENIF